MVQIIYCSGKTCFFLHFASTVKVYSVKISLIAPSFHLFKGHVCVNCGRLVQSVSHKYEPVKKLKFTLYYAKNPYNTASSVNIFKIFLGIWPQVYHQVIKCNISVEKSLSSAHRRLF